MPWLGVRRGSGGSGTGRAAGSSGVTVYWQGPCVWLGGEPEAAAGAPDAITMANERATTAEYLLLNAYRCLHAVVKRRRT